MGLFDAIKKGSGATFTEDNSGKVETKSMRVKAGPKSVSDKELKRLESEVSKAIQRLQLVQERLRVKRGY